MAEVPWEIIIERCGASFDSIRDIFVHSLQAEHLWIRRLSGKSTEGIYGTPFSQFSAVKPIQAYGEKVHFETNEYLGKINDENLKSIVEFKGREGKIERYKTEDILMHVIEEEIHHRGELLCLYWQHNIPPPYVSCIAYKVQTYV